MTSINKIHLSDYKFYQFLLFIMGFLLTAVSIFCCVLLAYLTNRAALMEMDAVMELIIYLSVAYLLQALFQYGYSYQQKKFLASMQQELEVCCAKKLSRISMIRLEQQKTGDLLERFQVETENTAALIAEQVPEIILQSMKIILYTFVMLFIHWPLTVLYLLIIVLVAAAQFLLSKPLRKAAKIVRSCSGSSNAIAQDILTQRKTMKVFQGGGKALGWYEKRAGLEARNIVKSEAISSPIHVAGLFFGMLPVLTLCIVGIVMVSNGFASLTSFMILFFLGSNTQADILHYSDLFARYRKGQASRERLSELLDLPDEEEEWRSLNPQMEELGEGILSFDGVFFRYDANQADWTLSDISFTLCKGEKVAFVGQSGCGKSTILKLIAGFLPASKGSISLYQRSYQERSLASIRERMAMVFQSSHLFLDSIKENIKMGRKEDVDDGRLAKICEQAQITQFIGMLSQGLDTQAGEGGAKLSGGQLQRIAIGRALLKKADILIFDEAASALDAGNEMAIQQVLDQTKAYDLVISVTHRLSSIQNFDRIFYMEKGKIAESGSHRELLEKNGGYAALYRMQRLKEESFHA